MYIVNQNFHKSIRISGEKKAQTQWIILKKMFSNILKKDYARIFPKLKTVDYEYGQSLKQIYIFHLN